ncbi:MAG: DUF302 domain-containing protein [Terracidiphilus sp.]
MKKFANLRRATLLVALFAAISVTSVFAQDSRVNVLSTRSYQQTVDAFKMAVSKGGMMVMSTVDQGNMLKMTGLDMKGTLFLIGNPNVGKQVFEKNPAAGLYLPLRVYIYQGTDGKTFVSYDKPSVLLKQFDNGGIDQIAAMLDQKLDMLTHMVAR